MLPIAIKPADGLIKSYYEALAEFDSLHATHEGAVSKAFQDLLSGYSRKLKLIFQPQYQMNGRLGRISVDGAVLDTWKQRRGFWEAKDEHDDLVLQGSKRENSRCCG